MKCKCEKREGVFNCLMYCCDAPFHFKLRKHGVRCVNCNSTLEVEE